MRKLYLFFVVFLIAAHAGAQDSAMMMNALMQRINTLHANKNAFFTTGIFPSYISNRPRFSKHKKDNNIFFTALVDYTLGNLYSTHLIDSSYYFNIHTQASSAYPHFKNKKGRTTYNFWRTDTAYIFPYTWWINKIKKNTALPDDMDDTVLSLFAQDTDSTTAAAVHAAMQEYINDNDHTKVIDKTYRSYPAYSVWYGRHFPVVLDVCVLTNVLSFVQHYNLPWTPADSASLQVIITAVKSGDYIKKPLAVSPYYGNTSIILYHIARLMSIKPIPGLEALKVQLLTMALQQFAQTKNPLEKAILCTTILKLGYVPPPFEMPAIAAIEHNNLPFFIGNIPSYFSTYTKQFFTNKGFGLFYHYCPAYNDALFLEYLVLKNSIANN